MRPQRSASHSQDTRRAPAPLPAGAPAQTGRRGSMTSMGAPASPPPARRGSMSGSRASSSSSLLPQSTSPASPSTYVQVKSLVQHDQPISRQQSTPSDFAPAAPVPKPRPRPGSVSGSSSGASSPERALSGGGDGPSFPSGLSLAEQKKHFLEHQKEAFMRSASAKHSEAYFDVKSTAQPGTSASTTSTGLASARAARARGPLPAPPSSGQSFEPSLDRPSRSLSSPVQRAGSERLPREQSDPNTYALSTAPKADVSGDGDYATLHEMRSGGVRRPPVSSCPSFSTTCCRCHVHSMLHAKSLRTHCMVADVTCCTHCMVD
jgi:hypothetical protein